MKLQTVLLIFCSNFFIASLSFTQSVEIDETEALITSISNVSFSPDGSKFLINDTELGDTKVFDTKTGKLIKHLKLPLYFSDTVTNLMLETYGRDTLFSYQGQKIVPITIPELGKKIQFDYNEQSIKMWFQNAIIQSHFINNDKIASTLIAMIPSIVYNPKIKKYHWVGFPQTLLEVYSIIENERTLSFINSKMYLDDNYDIDLIPDPTGLLILGLNHYYLTCSNAKYRTGEINELEYYNVMEYKSGELAPVGYLSKEFISSNVNYNYNGSFIDVDTEDDLYQAYQLLPYVYKNSKIHFQLKPAELYEVNKAFSEKHEQDSLEVSFFKKMNYTIFNFGIAGNGLFVNLYHTPDYPVDSLKTKNRIQKYTFDGILTDDLIYPIEIGYARLQCVAYNPAERELYAFIYDKENEIWKYETVNFDN